MIKGWKTNGEVCHAEQDSNKSFFMLKTMGAGRLQENLVWQRATFAFDGNIEW